MTEIPNERKATSMYEKAEVSSRVMFLTYKAKAQQQWISKVKVNEWKEGEEPNFTGMMWFRCGLCGGTIWVGISPHHVTSARSRHTFSPEI